MKRKKVLVISAIALLVVIVGYLYFGRNKQAGYDFVLAKRGDIIQEVSVTGHIKPAEDVDLAFEKSGKVSYVYVKVADKISVSQKLITLENYELLAQLIKLDIHLPCSSRHYRIRSSNNSGFGFWALSSAKSLA